MAFSRRLRLTHGIRDSRSERAVFAMQQRREIILNDRRDTETIRSPPPFRYFATHLSIYLFPFFFFFVLTTPSDAVNTNERRCVLMSVNK